MKVSSLPQAFYACCWVDPKTGIIHPNPDTISSTTQGCSQKANDILGTTRRQRAARGFRILPFHIHFEPAWADVPENKNVTHIKDYRKS